jgi:hypothetical protein
MSLRQNILETIEAYITGFNTNTPEGTIVRRSPTCTHRFLPPSPDQPLRTNAEYRDFISPNFAFMRNFHLKLLEGQPPIIDEQARKAVIHLTSTADSPVGEYRNSYVFTFGFSEDGKEIEEVLEFVDAKTLGEFVPKLLSWIREHAGASAAP